MTALCLNSQEFNAFAAPGGIVGMNRGVYLDLVSESEVMAVLAHELAHLAQRHHYRGLRNSQRLSTGTLATLAGVVAAIATRQSQAAQSLIWVVRRQMRPQHLPIRENMSVRQTALESTHCEVPDIPLLQCLESFRC